MTLSQYLPQNLLSQLQPHFSFPIGEIPCEWGDSDGQLTRMASARSDGLFSSGGKIIFDPADLPQSGASWYNPLIVETVAHELTHIEQYRRGLFYRLKIKLWKQFLSYEKRPHEKEAFEKGKQLAQSLILVL